MTSTISEYVEARPSVADCLTGMVVRDTRGCTLDQAQRFDFYPAEPVPAVTSRIVGHSHLVARPDHMERPWAGPRLPGFSFRGAQLAPTVLWSPGEVYRIGIGFFPDALAAMTGLDLSSFTGRTLPAAEALPQPLLGICRNFFDAVPRQGPERSFADLQNEIEVMWAGVRPGGSRPATARWTGWSRSVVHRATVTGLGRSTRQIARRVKSWTGVGQRDLQRFEHIGRLQCEALGAPRTGDVDWAALAAASGFTDQAHMIRRFKQHTGFTPEKFLESYRDDEAFWYYRLLDEIAHEYLHRQKGSGSISCRGSDHGVSDHGVEWSGREPGPSAGDRFGSGLDAVPAAISIRSSPHQSPAARQGNSSSASNGARKGS